MIDPDTRTSQEVAATLQAAATYMRSAARTLDWFVGYSTSEAIRERIAEIGEDSFSRTEAVGTGATRRLTRLAQLNVLEDAVKQAVLQAMDLP